MNVRNRFLLAFFVSLFTTVSFAQEAKIQSGILYYFTNYVEWPPAKSSGNFVIGVVGNADITPYLEQMASSKTVGARKIVIKKLSNASSGGSCHIIFLPKSKISEFSSATSVAKSNSCLLVTDSPGYGKKGAGINFIVQGGKPSFEINDSAVSSCNLKVSSKLKSLGTVI